MPQRPSPLNPIDAISLGGRRQVLLHLPEDLYRRLKEKAEQEKRKISAQAELYLEIMLGLKPEQVFQMMHRQERGVPP